MVLAQTHTANSMVLTERQEDVTLCCCQRNSYSPSQCVWGFVKWWRKGLRKGGEKRGMLWTFCIAVWAIPHRQHPPKMGYRGVGLTTVVRVCHQPHRRQEMNQAQGPSREPSQEQKEMAGLEDRAAVYLVGSIQETSYPQHRSKAHPWTGIEGSILSQHGSWAMGWSGDPSGAGQCHWDLLVPSGPWQRWPALSQ